MPEVHPLRHEALTTACRAVPPGAYYPDLAAAAHDLLPTGPQDWTAFTLMALAAVRADPGTTVGGRPASPDDLADDAARALRRQAAFSPTVADRHRLLDEAAHIRPWGTWS